MTASAFRPTPILRERRRKQVVRLRLRDGDGELDAIVRDVSSRGVSAVAHAVAPDEGAAVLALLPDGRELWGLVRWVDGRAFGVEFDTGAM